MSDNAAQLYRLPQGFCIEIAGDDALKVVNNLSTNDLEQLEEHSSTECFVTNIKGWTVAHAIVLKQPDRIVLFGQHPDAEQICSHIDRYIIREDAAITNRSSQRSLLLHYGSTSASANSADVQRLPIRFMGCELLVLPSDSEVSHLAELDLPNVQDEFGSEDAFESLRVQSFWPAMEREIGEKTIPQELDRDACAISFTKGCYLGQETIARLDARGQLQKKLCRLVFPAGAQLTRGMPLSNADKEVGTLTSVAPISPHPQALAFIKRGSNTPGTELSSEVGTATVVEPFGELDVN